MTETWLDIYDLWEFPASFILQKGARFTLGKDNHPYLAVMHEDEEDRQCIICLSYNCEEEYCSMLRERLRAARIVHGKQ